MYIYTYTHIYIYIHLRNVSINLVLKHTVSKKSGEAKKKSSSL